MCIHNSGAQHSCMLLQGHPKTGKKKLQLFNLLMPQNVTGCHEKNLEPDLVQEYLHATTFKLVTGEFIYPS